MSETNKTNTERVYLRIEPELKEAMQEYCERHDLTMSMLVKRFFRKLLAKEKADHEASQF